MRWIPCDDTGSTPAVRRSQPRLTILPLILEASIAHPPPVDNARDSPVAVTSSPTARARRAMPWGFRWMKSPVSRTTPLASP
jgi:hypothetical protein